MKKYLIVLILTVVPAISFGFLNPPQFIGLIPPGAHQVLERENQIAELCPIKNTDHEKCRAENLKPQSWSLNVYQDKSSSSKKLGTIFITATPGKGIEAVFTGDDKKTVPLNSDSKQTDWGYSSYFEFSLTDVQGDWLQLPKRPFATPVWINLKADWKTTEKPGKEIASIFPTPASMEAETIYSVKKLGNVVITKFEGKTFTYRNENPNDMLCGDEPKKIPPGDLKTQTKPISELFDEDGHLIAWVAYSRGC